MLVNWSTHTHPPMGFTLGGTTTGYSAWAPGAPLCILGRLKERCSSATIYHVGQNPKVMDCGAASTQGPLESARFSTYLRHTCPAQAHVNQIGIGTAEPLAPWHPPGGMLVKRCWNEGVRVSRMLSPSLNAQNTLYTLLITCGYDRKWQRPIMHHSRGCLVRHGANISSDNSFT